MNLKISYNWLKEYFKTEKSVKDFAKEFSLKSQTVESAKELDKGLDQVVVGKLIEVEPPLESAITLLLQPLKVRIHVAWHRHHEEATATRTHDLSAR